MVIDNKMRTNLCDVYAAGDVCTASWTHSQLWFQVLCAPLISLHVCVCVADEAVDSGKTDGDVRC